MCHSYILGLHHNVRQLIVLQNKLSIPYDDSLTLADIKSNISDTYKRRRRIKIADSLSLEYRMKLAQAKEEAGEVKAATYIRTLNNIERQRRLYQNIKVMEDKIKGGSTSKVTITDNEGVTKEYLNKTSIEQVIANYNEYKYHASEGSSQLHHPALTSKLGTYGEGPEIDQVLKGTFQFPPNCNTYTKDCLENCKCVDSVDSVRERDDIRTRYVKPEGNPLAPTTVM